MYPFAIRRSGIAAAIIAATITTAASATPLGLNRVHSGEPQLPIDRPWANTPSEQVMSDRMQGPQRRIIVKLRDDQSAGATMRQHRAEVLAQEMQAQQGLRMEFGRSLAVGAELFRLTDARSMSEALAVLRADPRVEYAEEDRLMHPLFTPNDTRYSEQWDLYEATGGLNADAAWDSADGSGVVVAVIDTGYRPHADLAANILPGYDMISDTFVSQDGNGRDSDPSDPGDWSSAGECYTGSPASDSSWHGTHVAGTIAAVTNNGNGVAGIAYNAKVVPVRVLGRCGGYTSDIADAIVWASGGSVSGAPANANPAQVINMSLGGSGACDSTTQAAINTARGNGTTVIVAAGNENQNASNSNPANCSGVVTVAATGRTGGRAYYSNYGSVVDVAAPGGELYQGDYSDGILSTLNAGTTTPGADSYALYQGTSMATPHVVGVAALMYSVNSSITPDQVESMLKSTARSFPASCSQCGSGIVDAAAAAVTAAAGGSGGGGGGGGSSTVLENGIAVTGLSASTGADVSYTMEVPAGATGLSFAISGGSGDADLYVKFGSAPTTSSYDCRPYLSGNNETCDIATAQAGTYYVMVRAYASFASVSLVGSYTEDTGGGGGGEPSTCPAGYETYEGTLTSGATVNEPDGSYYYSGSSGTHSAILMGPVNADFDLYLDFYQRSRWRQKASSTGSSSEESISYSGGKGYYTYRVVSYSGSGDYTLCIDHP